MAGYGTARAYAELLGDQEGTKLLQTTFEEEKQTDQKLTFPLLSDFNKEVIRDYGAFNEDMIGLKGIAKRSVFVIDKDGIVKYREVLDDARNEPDYQKVYDTLATLS